MSFKMAMISTFSRIYFLLEITASANDWLITFTSGSVTSLMHFLRISLTTIVFNSFEMTLPSVGNVKHRNTESLTNIMVNGADI